MGAEAWPHAPAHWNFEPGIYMLTSGIYQKRHLLNTPAKRDMVLAEIFSTAREFGWNIEAWAVLINHYHLLARTQDPSTLSLFMRKLHGNTARKLNREDGTQGRRVWYQFWDSRITYERSWLARLKYINNNPVHHELTDNASAYRWCSAAWFARNASNAFSQTVENFNTDNVSVVDDF